MILYVWHSAREGFLREAVSDQICGLGENGLHGSQVATGEPSDSTL